MVSLSSLFHDEKLRCFEHKPHMFAPKRAFVIWTPNFWWKDNGFETTRQLGAIALLNATGDLSSKLVDHLISYISSKRLLLCYVLQVNLTFSFYPSPSANCAFRLGSFATDSFNQLPTGDRLVSSQLLQLANCQLFHIPSIETKNRFVDIARRWGVLPLGLSFSISSCLLKGCQLVHTCATMMGTPCVVLNHVSWCVEMEPPQTISQIEIPSHCESFCGPFPNTFGVLGVPKHRASSKIFPSRIEIPNWATQVGCFWHLNPQHNTESYAFVFFISAYCMQFTPSTHFDLGSAASSQ